MESARKLAPGELVLVQDFVNTTKLLYDQEGLSGEESLRRWLVQRGLLRSDEEVDTAGFAEALELRDSLRALMLANNSAACEPAAIDGFNRALDRGALRASATADGRPVLAPSVEGVRGALAMIASRALLAMVKGSWQRLKACANPDCKWSFYDGSPNRAGTWCEMSVCGSRAKMRAYRRRRTAFD